MQHNKFDLIPCECGRCLRHRTAEQECRTCKQDEANAAAQAVIEWAMVGEIPVNWSEVAQERVPFDEAEYRESFRRSGKDD